MEERTEKPDPSLILDGKIPIVAKIGFDTGTIELRKDGKTKTNMILVKPGDLVVSGINAAKGAIAVYGEENEKPVAATIHYSSYIVNREKVIPLYLWYLLRSDMFRRALKTSRHSGIKTEMKPKRLLSIKVPIPYIEEQKKVVRKIMSIYEKLGSLKKTFSDMLPVTQDLRQSILDKAFNRELLSTGLKAQEWPSGKLGKLVYVAGRIGWRGLKASEYTDEGPLMLSVGNLNKGIIVDLSFGYHVSVERYNESPEIKLRNGDILLAKDGAGIGKVGLIEGLETEATVNSSLLLIRCGETFYPKFLLYFLKSTKLQDIVKQRIAGSATPHLFQRDIKEFQLVIPSLAEQKMIVERIESLFSTIDKIEATRKRNVGAITILEQSILCSTFREGKAASQENSIFINSTNRSCSTLDGYLK